MTQQSDLSGLTLLGKDNNMPSKQLETFPNHHHGRDYIVSLMTDEFTCICPATGQPDFANITIRYIPNQKIVESKSLKLYFWSYRNEGVFHEHVANVILDDLITALQPKWCEVVADFGIRGGIAISVHAEYNEDDKSQDL